MKKQVRFRTRNRPEWVNQIRVQHALPNKFARAVGPFVLLDHVSSQKRASGESNKQVVGKCSHPCRGVATLTYIISGEVEHLDSLGNHVNLSSGGVHWMNAGKGIVQGEAVNPECRINDPNLSVVRLWINLPSKHKSGEPDYLSLESSDIPKQVLVNGVGWIKILSGKYENLVAKVPCYSKQLLYHIQLEAGKQFSIMTDSEWEYAAFFPAGSAVASDTGFQAGELIVFSTQGELIEINNYRKTPLDIILFGGEPYSEPIIAEGNFVMNNPHEITQAYNDYYDGKYGQIRPQ